MTRPQFRMEISLGHIVTMVVIVFGAGSAWMDLKGDTEEAHQRLDTVVETFEGRLMSVESTADSRNVRTLERIAAVEAVTHAAENRAARFDERMSALQSSLVRIERSQERLLNYVREINGEKR